jgi:hypothetical protein
MPDKAGSGMLVKRSQEPRHARKNQNNPKQCGKCRQMWDGRGKTRNIPPMGAGKGLILPVFGLFKAFFMRKMAIIESLKEDGK